MESECNHKPWIDWMKVIGMALIVFGHSGGQSLLPKFTNPINIKQLGVAFFVFIAGYTLSSERRKPWFVVFHRYFDVAFFGLMTAIILSIVNLIRHGDLNESNYLPYILGVNVLDNDFPANSTTWFSGCYFHILVLWAVLWRRLTPSILVFCIVGILEVAVRAGIICLGREYTAYMLFTNWMLVFLIGQRAGKREAIQNKNSTIVPLEKGSNHRSAFVSLVFATTLAMIWSVVIRSQEISFSTTFGRFPKLSPTSSAFATSFIVSLQYVTYTLAAFHCTKILRSSRWVKFLAKHTLIVFLVHMPLVLAVVPWLKNVVLFGWLRALISQVIFFIGIAVMSSIVLRIVPNREIKSWVDRNLFSRKPEHVD